MSGSIPTPTEAECAYAAGLLDGEGYIGIDRRSRGNYHRVKVRVAITDRRIPRWLAEKFGGRCNTVYRYDDHRKDLHYWDCEGATLERFLPAVLPYLIIKREHALIALEFRSTALERSGGRAGRRLTADVITQREGFRQRLMALNRRGV